MRLTISCNWYTTSMFILDPMRIFPFHETKFLNILWNFIYNVYLSFDIEALSKTFRRNFEPYFPIELVAHDLNGANLRSIILGKVCKQWWCRLLIHRERALESVKCVHIIIFLDPLCCTSTIILKHHFSSSVGCIYPTNDSRMSDW